MSCAGCRNSATPSSLASCGRSRAMICVAVALRSSCGFSPMKKRAVLSVLPLPLPKKVPKRRDVGIAREHGRDLALQPLHLLRRHVLRGLRDAADQAGVLGREEALRDRDEQRGGERDRGEEHQQGDEAMAQHQVEPARVGVHQRVEHPLDGAIEAAVLLALAHEEARAQHRRRASARPPPRPRSPPSP